MKQRHRDDQAPATLDALIETITVDARGDDEKFWAFRQAFEDHIVVPCDAFVIGEPVLAIAFDYDGNERRGLTARCRRADGAEHVVAACDVVLPPSADAGRYLAAYRRWLGWNPTHLRPTRPGVPTGSTEPRRPTSTSAVPSSCWRCRSRTEPRVAG